MVIKVKNPAHPSGTFTIRGKTSGHTIEKIYPLSFRKFQKVLLLDEFKTARAKLYYIRDKVGKDAKMKSLLTQDEKGIDLLEVAMAVAAKAQAAIVSDPIEPKPGDQSQDTPVQPSEVPAETQQEEVQEQKAEQQESQEQNQQENQQQQEDAQK